MGSKLYEAMGSPFTEGGEILGQAQAGMEGTGVGGTGEEFFDAQQNPLNTPQPNTQSTTLLPQMRGGIEPRYNRGNSLTQTDITNTNLTPDQQAEMEQARKEIKEQTFLDNMRKAFGDFADNPTIKKIARGALMILNGIPTAVDFIPMSLLEQTLGTMDGSKEIKAAKGGMMNINDITRPVGMAAGGSLGDSVMKMDTLVKIMELEGALSLKDSENLRKMSSTAIDKLHQQTFGKGK